MLVFITINSTRQGIRTLVIFSCNIDTHYRPTSPSDMKKGKMFPTF